MVVLLVISVTIVICMRFAMVINMILLCNLVRSTGIYLVSVTVFGFNAIASLLLVCWLVISISMVIPMVFAITIIIAIVVGVSMFALCLHRTTGLNLVSICILCFHAVASIYFGFWMVDISGFVITISIVITVMFSFCLHRTTGFDLITISVFSLHTVACIDSHLSMVVTMIIAMILAIPIVLVVAISIIIPIVLVVAISIIISMALGLSLD